MNLYLVGMMGVGKSTVGCLLAERLGWPFLDLDALIEAEVGMPVSAFFAQAGEQEFRDREEALLARIVGGWRPVQAGGSAGAGPTPSGRAAASAEPPPPGRAAASAEPPAAASAEPPPVVVGTGGGAVLREVNRERMRVTGFVVWLEAETDLLLQRALAEGVAKRPLLAGADPANRLTEILAHRRPLYGMAAHRQIPTGGRPPAAVAAEIIGLLEGGLLHG